VDDAARILPNLLLGRAPLTPADVLGLKRRGVTAVLSLQTDADCAAWGLSWPLLVSWYRTAGLEVRRVPIEDWSAQAVLDHLDEAVAELGALLDAGHTVYLHCTAGVNRSPSVALGYLRRIRGEPLKKALRHLRRRRPQVDPYPEVLDALRGA
jgi:hypothetical protein